MPRKQADVEREEPRGLTPLIDPFNLFRIYDLAPRKPNKALQADNLIEPFTHIDERRIP